MKSTEFELGNLIVARAEHDSDLLQLITELAERKNIEMGVFTVIGALKTAKLGFYEQENHEYREITVDYPCEIASCIGNISLLDGEPFVHAHAVITDETGRAIGGHLSQGKVFASEVHLQELISSELERKHDDVTDLALWRM